MTTNECYSCDREAEFENLPLREKVAYDDHWRVVHAFGTSHPGWLVLAPRRHVMEIADLSDAEAAGLGEWQRRLSRTLADELGVAKTYVASFGEQPGFHLHFHVIPRPADLDREFIGPNVFSLMGKTGDAELDEPTRDEIATRLSASSWLRPR